ncbi:MAG: hypothetical protein PHE68_02590 [Candidatus Peribacteraceae bacterium]|nr:hypothetical protein [Candidatus Peribacteraceae bacterium]
MPNSTLLDIVSLDPEYQGKPTPEVLRCFQIRVLRTDEDAVTLSIDFCTNPLLISPRIPLSQYEACIESLILGLRFGHAAAGYRKIGGMWVPSKEGFAS